MRGRTKLLQQYNNDKIIVTTIIQLKSALLSDIETPITHIIRINNNASILLPPFEDKCLANAEK